MSQRSLPKKYRSNRRGATVLELALVAPLFSTLVFAMFDSGRIMMIQHAATNAAREGSRTAVLGSTDSANRIDTAVREALQSTTAYAWNDDIVRVSIPDVSTATAPGTPLTVSVEIDFAEMSWFPLQRLGRELTLGADSTRTRE